MCGKIVSIISSTKTSSMNFRSMAVMSLFLVGFPHVRQSQGHSAVDVLVAGGFSDFSGVQMFLTIRAQVFEWLLCKKLVQAEFNKALIFEK